MTSACAGGDWKRKYECTWVENTSTETWRAISKQLLGQQDYLWMDVSKEQNNDVESFHNTSGQLVTVSQPSLYAFMEYLQEVALSNMADVQRLDRGGQIRRPKKKQNVMNDKRIRSAVDRYSVGGYTVTQFLQRAQCSHCKHGISYSNSVRLSVCLSVRLSVRPSVRLSHAGIVSKRRHVARCSLHHWIAKYVQFFRNQKYSLGTTPPPWNFGSKWPTHSWRLRVLTCFAL